MLDKKPGKGTVTGQDVWEEASAATEMQRGHKHPRCGGTAMPEREDHQCDFQRKVRETSSRYFQRVMENKKMDTVEGSTPTSDTKCNVFCY